MTSAAAPPLTVLLGPFFTRHEAAQRAHLPPTQLLEHDGLIRLAGSFSVEEAYFAFQFDGSGIRSDVATVVETLERRFDACRSADWLARPHSDLNGKAPLEWLRTGGRPDAVLELAGHLDESAPVSQRSSAERKRD